MKKNLILMSALFAGSMIVNSGFGANLEVDINNVDELTTRNRLSTLNVNDLIELAGDVKRLSSPRYANHDLFSPEMVSDVLNRILMVSGALNRILIEIRNKKGHLYLDQNRNFDTFLYAYQDNRDAWDLITSDRMDDKKYAFSSLDNTIKYLKCYSQLDNTIKSDLIKHLARERDKALIDYWANIKLSYQVSIEDLIQELIGIADSIECNLDDAYSDEEISSMHDKIFATLTDRNFKFDDCKHLTNFIGKYKNCRRVIDIITPYRLSNIDTFDLLSIAARIKNGWNHFSNLQEQEKEPMLNKIFTALSDRDFKFESFSLMNFINAYYGNTKAMDLITPDRLSNINTLSLLVTADNIKNRSVPNMQKETKELILNKILATLTNRDFKFADSNRLQDFICAYYDNTEAMDLLTPDRLSKIKTHYLIETADNIKEEHYPFSNLRNPEKELILNKILTTLTNRDFKFDDSNRLKNFIRAYHDNAKAMDFITPDRLSNIETHYLIETADNIREAYYPLSNLQDTEKKLILNKILTVLTNRDLKFGDNWTSLYTFIRAYYDNTKAMDFITSDRLSDVPTEQLKSSAKLLNDFLPRATPSEKANIQRVIDIIDQKLHPIFFAIKSSIKYLFSFI